jgi:hypothetical protein
LTALQGRINLLFEKDGQRARLGGLEGRIGQ